MLRRHALLAPWWALALPACVAPRAFTFEVVELELELAEDQPEVGFEIVLDIRDGVMPDPEVYDGDQLWVDVSLPGRIDVDVSIDRQPRPAKGGRGRGGHIFELNDITRDCPLDDGCQRVVAVTVTRERTAAATLWLSADFQLWTTQGAINVFPSRATEQEIRLRAFED